MQSTILVDFLLANRENVQFDLFSKAEHPYVLIDGINEIINEGKCLYMQWNQKVGDKIRSLSKPKPILKEFIQGYFLPMIKRLKIHSGCHGGEKNWSVKKSLETHLPCKTTLAFDLKGAFENTSYEKVSSFFESIAVNSGFGNEKKEIAEFLASISTINYWKNGVGKRGLPQGSSLSIALFNRMLFPLDLELSEKANKRELRYSRWVDDITISSYDDKPSEQLLGAVALTNDSFKVAENKIYFQNRFPIYLLGHKILEGGIIKNSKEDRLANKVAPLDFSKMEYVIWN